MNNNRPNDWDTSPGNHDAGQESFAQDLRAAETRGIRRLFLAGLGAVAYMGDTAQDTFDSFVDRGTHVQDELRGRADDVRRQNSGARARAQDYYRSAVDSALDRANLPSKGDLDTINVKLNILSRKLDDLQLHRVETAAADAVPPASTPSSPPVSDESIT